MLLFHMEINAFCGESGVFTYSLWPMAILTMLKVVFIFAFSFHCDSFKKSLLPCWMYVSLISQSFWLTHTWSVIGSMVPEDTII